MKRIFSTAGIHPRNAFGRWSEVIFERIVPVEQSQVDDRPFEGQLKVADVGSLSITKVYQGALRTEATPTTIRRHNKHDTLSVTLKLSGVSTSEQDGRESVQNVGDMVVLDRRPTVLSSSHGSQSLFLEIPRDRMETMLGPTRLYTALTVGSDLASCALVGTYFSELARQHSRLSFDVANRMASIGVDLIIASISERLALETPYTIQGTVLVQRAKAFVETNLGNHELDPPYLAAAIGVSLRRLQQLFNERGQHISEWIWDRRLIAAAKRIADPGCGHLPIGTLAYSCGFASQSHFSTRFRRRFGVSPSEYRKFPL